jgi:bacteriocin-like protein
MKELAINDYGMEELSTKEMTEVDGGCFWCFAICLAFLLLR